jgi:hypothetical protein
VVNREPVAMRLGTVMATVATLDKNRTYSLFEKLHTRNGRTLLAIGSTVGETKNKGEK